MRKPEGIDVGPLYSGSRISREALDDDADREHNSIDSHDDDDGLRRAVDDDSEEDAKEETNGLMVIEDEDHDEEAPVKSSVDSFDFDGHIDEGQNSDKEEDEDLSEGPSEVDEDLQDDRATVRKMMAEEQETVAASLSRAAKADVEKGKAIKQQRATFDALLNTRIKLQKSLIATNSLSASSTSDITTSDHTKTINAAETAALTLWTSLNSLRFTLHPQNPKKRPFAATLSTPTSTLWTEMSSHETHSLPIRRATLNKWSQKTNPTSAVQRMNKFSQTPTQQPLTSVLDQSLSGSNMEKLVAKTRIPRSCAPVQVSQRVSEDASIYDDADFYTLLLRELVDQRMNDSHATTSITHSNGTNKTIISSLPNHRDLKIKKRVDTKASKGRKMRYTVHEKLQNFMAPEDRGSWGERQRGELFGSLLGRRISMGEDEDADADADLNGGDEEALKLFK